MVATLNWGADQPAHAPHLPEQLDCGRTVANRYGAVSMQLAVYFESRHVELHILTDRGELIAVACPGDSILALQQHIEQIGRQCPEISGWNTKIDLSEDRG